MRPSVIFLFLFLAGCAILTPPADPQKAEIYRQQAEERVAARDWSGAAELLGRAAAISPDAGSLYLHQGELLERAGDPAAARRAYGKGLKAVSAADSSRPALAWRLALVEALRLDLAGKAKGKLDQLPPGSPEHDDLLGVLALRSDKPREAIDHFNRALGLNPGEDVASTVLYHASLAYRRVGDEKNTFGSLFHAINRAQNLGVIADIERLWNELNLESPAP